jgi:chromosome partitioning protein
MILVVGQTKGGVGKTLLAVNIAAALAHGGADVLLVDGDEQASAATFAQIRAELALPGGAFTTVQLQGPSIRQEVKTLRHKYDEVVVDVGGRDTGALRAALTIADAILMPFQPRSVDLWAGAQIGALVAEARSLKDDLQAYAVINAADFQGRDNEDAAAALRAIEGVETLPLVVGRRKAFPNAFSVGLSVLEQRPQDPKAVDELIAIVHTLYARSISNGHQRATTQAAC